MNDDDGDGDGDDYDDGDDDDDDDGDDDDGWFNYCCSSCEAENIQMQLEYNRLRFLCCTLQTIALQHFSHCMCSTQCFIECYRTCGQAALCT